MILISSVKTEKALTPFEYFHLNNLKKFLIKNIDFKQTCLTRTFAVKFATY